MQVISQKQWTLYNVFTHSSNKNKHSHSVDLKQDVNELNCRLVNSTLYKHCGEFQTEQRLFNNSFKTLVQKFNPNWPRID